MPNGEFSPCRKTVRVSAMPSPSASRTSVIRLALGTPGVPSANRITLVRDADGDGIAETRTVFLQGLNSPFGMTLVGSDLYVANSDALVRFPYRSGATQISAPPEQIDERVKPQRPDLVAKALAPDYALGTHTASLGLVFYAGRLFPSRYANGAFVGQHGSWNRKPRAGYKVIFVPFANGHPAGMPEDVLTGFVNADGEAYGRPVGVAIDAAGALLVADDVGNAVWRVMPAAIEKRVALLH